jgi:hypothetical protein
LIPKSITESFAELVQEGKEHSKVKAEFPEDVRPMGIYGDPPLRLHGKQVVLLLDATYDGQDYEIYRCPSGNR